MGVWLYITRFPYLLIPRREAEGGYRNAPSSARPSVCHFGRNTFVSTPYLLNPLNDFDKTSLKCFSQQDGVQSTKPSYLDSMSRSQVNVKGFTLAFRVCSISPEHF